MSETTLFAPSAQLSARVRGGLVMVGSNLSRWSRERGYKVQNVQSALIGRWDGPKARELRAEIVNHLREKGVMI